MWKKSKGELVEDDLAARVGLAQPDVVEARPLEHHQPGLHVDLLEHPVRHAAVGRAADRGEVAEDRVIGRDQRRPAGSELEVVQIGLRAVAGPHVRDVRVGAVGDHILAAARTRAPRCRPATTSAPACPRIPAPAGSSPIRARGSGLNHSKPPARVEDHRARLARPGVRRDELVAAAPRRRGLRGHGDHRRMQVRTRVEALHFVGAAGMDRLGRGADRILARRSRTGRRACWTRRPPAACAQP